MVNEWTHIVKKTSVRALVVCLCLFGFNTLYSRYFWEDDLDKHGPMLLELNQIQDTCDIIYFGESSNFTTHPSDTLKYRISDFIAQQHPDQRFGTMNHGAYHVGMYLPLVSQIDTSNSVHTIIVTMNLRTFNQDVIYGGSEANLRLSSRFYEDCPPLYNRVMVSLNHYDNRSGHERDILKWYEWTFDTLHANTDSIEFHYNTIKRWCEVPKFVDSAGVQDNQKRQLADQYVKAYAFQIDSTNPMVVEFDKLLETAKQKNFKVVFNLIPENVQDARYYIGENLVWLMQSNRDYLVDRYTKRGALVVDNLEILPNHHFLDRKEIPQEHYDAKGRELIGQRVAQSMRQNLK